MRVGLSNPIQHSHGIYVYVVRWIGNPGVVDEGWLNGKHIQTRIA